MFLVNTMTMHLEKPWLSTSGKKKGKKKFRSAEDAQRARALEESWSSLQKKWGVEQDDKRKKRAVNSGTLKYSLAVPHGRGTSHIKSVDSGQTGAIKTKDVPQYTGTSVIGISVMHKSCLQPVFNQEEAIAAAKMRR